MIFTKDLLFVHVPKTGGMSMTQYLLDALPRPIYYSLPQPDPRLTEPGIVQVPGARHETLQEARELVARYGFDLAGFPMILAVIRNPYAIEVSRYAYLQAGHPWDKGHSQQLALTRDFAAFAADGSYHAGRPLEDYFLLDGHRPANLRIVRFEELEAGVTAALRELGLQPRASFPHVNQSRHDDISSYYTPAAEEAVYAKYRWVFEQGLYERMAAADPAPSRPADETPRLPIIGAEQVGRAEGVWPDLWVEKSLRFQIRAHQVDVSSLTLSGLLPRQGPSRSEMVVGVDERIVRSSFDTDKPLSWTIPCAIPRGASARIEVVVSPTWCPRETSASRDGRHLGFRLNRIIFTASEAPLAPAAPAAAQAAV